MHNSYVMHRFEAPVGAALAALADPTRREMVELLAERPRRVGELVAAFPVSQSVEVPVDPAAAFRLYTAEINRWWKRDSWYWNDRERARGLRIEPFVGGRFVEVYDDASGEGAKELLGWYAEAAVAGTGAGGAGG